MAHERSNGPDPVDWLIAERVAAQALRLLKPPPFVDPRSLEATFDEITGRAQELVEEATGLHSGAGPAHAVVLDRTGWVRANIGSFRRLLRPLGEQLASGDRQDRRSLSPANRAAAGVEIGLMLAWMSGRVLGQYDIVPSEDAPSGDAVYYVGPNVVALERRHGFDPEQFRMWIALHETTHRVQFTGVEWMRGYFLELVSRGTALVTPDARFVLDRLRHAVEELRQGQNPLADGGVVALLATSEQLATLREAQGFMSLLEGHSNYVMSRAAPAIVPRADEFAAVLAQRRASATGVARVVQQAIGLEAKLRQYAEGEQFVRAVVEAGGPELFAKVWEAPENLPSIEEIREPSRWVARCAAAAEHR